MLTDDAKRVGIHPSQDWRKIKLNQLEGPYKLSLADALGIENPEGIVDLDQVIKEKLKNDYKPPKK